MFKIIFFLLNFFYAIFAWSDCTFNITNYSDTPVVVEGGFYAGQKFTATVPIASSKIIKNKKYFKL